MEAQRLTPTDIARGYIFCGCGQHAYVFSASVQLKSGVQPEPCPSSDAYMTPIAAIIISSTDGVQRDGQPH